MIKLRILKWVDYFGLSKKTQCNQKVFKMERGRQESEREENVTTKAEFEVTCKQNLRNLSPYTLKNVMDPLPSTKLPGGAAYFRLLSSRTIIV